jgi:hypothetical protein
VRLELWQGPNGQISQEEVQRHAAKEKPEEQSPASRATNLDHPAVAHGPSPAAELAAGPLEFQRTPAWDGDGGNRHVSEKQVVLRGCRFSRLCVLVDPDRTRRQLSSARRREREPAHEAGELFPQESRQRILGLLLAENHDAGEAAGIASALGPGAPGQDQGVDADERFG